MPDSPEKSDHRANIVRSIFSYIHNLANAKPGNTIIFILTFVGFFVGILGSYNRLPCQSQIAKGESCFDTAEVSSHAETSTTNVVRSPPQVATISPQAPKPAESSAASRPTEAKTEVQVPKLSDPNPIDRSVPAVPTQLAALGVWRSKGLNQDTPIAVFTAQSSSDGHQFVGDLSAALGKTFHLVDKSAAALSIEVSNFSLQSDLSGRPCTNPTDEAEHVGVADTRIRALWIDGTIMLPERSFHASAPSCKKVEAADAARGMLIKTVSEFLSSAARENK
jgi:hypothetical protein